MNPTRPLPLEAELPLPLAASPSPRTSRRRAPAWLAGSALAAALFVALPVAYLFVRAAQGGWAGYLDAVFSRSTLELGLRTLALVAGVVALSVALALPLAWLMVRSDLPARRLWAVLVALPLVFPSYIAAFTLVAALGPKGYLQGWLAPLGVERLPEMVYGYSGALLSLALFSYPYLFLLLVAALIGHDPALEENARNLGASRWQAFREITLPQLRPALHGGSLLICLYVLSDFGAVSLVRYDTFTLSIYNAYRALFDRTVAASLATVLVALTFAFIALEAFLLRRVRPSRSRPARPATPVALGRWRWPIQAGLALLGLLTLGVPLAVIGVWAWRAVEKGIGASGAWEASLGSLGVATTAAVVTVILSLPIAIWAVRHPRPLARATERLAYTGNALPGLVVALSLVFFATRWAPSLYQTYALLIAAYVVRFLPEALVATRSALVAISPRFEEAARTLGRSAASAQATVTLPLMRSGLLAGAALVFLTTLKELPATLILRPLGFETLATQVWSAAAEGIYSAAALPSLCLLLVSAPVMYWLIIRPALSLRGWSR